MTPIPTLLSTPTFGGARNERKGLLALRGFISDLQSKCWVLAMLKTSEKPAGDGVERASNAGAGAGAASAGKCPRWGGGRLVAIVVSLLLLLLLLLLLFVLWLLRPLLLLLLLVMVIVLLL